MFEVHIYIGVNNASPRRARKHYAYVLECHLESGDIRTKEGFGEIDGTYHRATLKAIAEAMGRLNQPCEVYLHTENGFVRNMMERNLEHWAADGFVNSRGNLIANREEWVRIWGLMQDQLVFVELGKHPYSEWMEGKMKRREQNV